MNWKRVKAEFPIFGEYPDLVYLDSAATGLKPRVVIDAIVQYYTRCSANVHRGLYRMAVLADREYDTARERVARFIGARSEEVVFVPGVTWGVNWLAREVERMGLGRGDEVVVTEVEHHSNLLPWMEVCRRTGAKLKYLPVDTEGRLDRKQVFELITPRTRVFAVCQVSNVVGVVNDVQNLSKLVKRESPECWVVVDGAQSVPHQVTAVRELGCDFLVFSGHKLYGPTGIGVVWGRREILEDMVGDVVGGGMVEWVDREGFGVSGIPERFEGGTPNVAGVVGLGAAVEWLSGEMNEVCRREEVVMKHTLGKLSGLGGVEVYGSTDAREKRAVVSFNVRGVHGHDVAEMLSETNVCVRAGNHCAMPLHRKLGINGSVRVSLGVYSTLDDIERLVDGLFRVRRVFRV